MTHELPSTSRSISSTSDAIRLHRQSYGEGHPLLILHGLLGAGGNWRTLSRNVFGKRYETVTPDLRNHGRSPHSERFSYAAMVADLVNLMEERGDESAHVLGHSMGGKTAMHLALERPDLVDRLVVVDIAPKAYEPAHIHIFEALEQVDPATFRTRDEIDQALGEHISSTPVRQFLMKNLERVNGRYRWKLNVPSIRSSYEEILAEISSNKSFDGPVLFVAAENSDYVSVNDMDHIRALFPEAELRTIEDAGHWVHAEKPSAFSDVVMNFLAI